MYERFEPAASFRLDDGASARGLSTLVGPFYGESSLKCGLLPCFGVSGAITELAPDDFRMKICETGRAARTQVVPVEYGLYNGEPATKVLLRPIQGRRHQLRLHLLHLGFPIIGDATYGPTYCAETGETDTNFYSEASRMCLHAYHLNLPFVSSGLRMKRRNQDFMQGKMEDLTFETDDPFHLETASLSGE